MDQITNYQPNKDLLKGRAILVTGASDGIGRAAAHAYAAHGATVLLLGRSLPKLEAVYDEIEAAGYAQPAILPMNLGHVGEHEYVQLAQNIQNEIGRLDGILHNAAVLGTLTPLQMYDAASFEQVMDVNFFAPFRLTQALLPLLNAAPDASVIFTSSSVGRQPKPFWGAYALSKMGLEGMMQIFSAELARVSHIRFNTLNPGATRTSMRAQAYPGEDHNLLPRPEEIMNTYLYLMGPDSKAVNGQSIDAVRP